MDIHDDNADGIDPIEFLRRTLAISQEDAETVRERTPGTRRSKPKPPPRDERADRGATD